MLSMQVLQDDDDAEVSAALGQTVNNAYVEELETALRILGVVADSAPAPAQAAAFNAAERAAPQVKFT